jgi:hypothetical protein
MITNTKPPAMKTAPLSLFRTITIAPETIMIIARPISQTEALILAMSSSAALCSCGQVPCGGILCRHSPHFKLTHYPTLHTKWCCSSFPLCIAIPLNALTPQFDTRKLRPGFGPLERGPHHNAPVFSYPAPLGRIVGLPSKWLHQCRCGRTWNHSPLYVQVINHCPISRRSNCYLWLRGRRSATSTAASCSTPCGSCWGRRRLRDAVRTSA